MNDREILIKFGNNVCAERNRKRLTQEKLAEKINISEKHLGKIERGLSNPKLTTIVALINALEIPFEILYK